MNSVLLNLLRVWRRAGSELLCESRGGRPWPPVPNSPYSLCGRKATLGDEQPVLGAAVSSEHNQVPVIVSSKCSYVNYLQ